MYDKQGRAKFGVKYWHAKYENGKWCPQHGAFNAFLPV
jgi:hypothetical protein